MDIKTNEIGDLLRSQIKNINDVDVNEVGEVLEIGDGVARTSGLGSVMSSELVEFQIMYLNGFKFRRRKCWCSTIW